MAVDLGPYCDDGRTGWEHAHNRLLRLCGGQGGASAGILARMRPAEKTYGGELLLNLFVEERATFRWYSPRSEAASMHQVYCGLCIIRPFLGLELELQRCTTQFAWAVRPLCIRTGVAVGPDVLAVGLSVNARGHGAELPVVRGRLQYTAFHRSRRFTSSDVQNHLSGSRHIIRYTTCLH